MNKFLTLAAFVAAGATSMHAGTISYSAFVDTNCFQPNCVTVSLSWADEPVPIFFAVVRDLFQTPLFSLNVPFPPATTGSIVPNPQTVSGLSANTIFLITNTSDSISAQVGELTTLNLLDGEGVVVDSVPFLATFANSGGNGNVPEPATWSMLGLGMTALFIGSRRFRRNSTNLR